MIHLDSKVGNYLLTSYTHHNMYSNAVTNSIFKKAQTKVDYRWNTIAYLTCSDSSRERLEGLEEAEE